eukprot:m.24341 g.24341  ORF g.24341 m.24341 type:complete len:287 (-) comp14558_c0_seq1:370-1230(-)
MTRTSSLEQPIPSLKMRVLSKMKRLVSKQKIVVKPRKGSEDVRATSPLSADDIAPLPASPHPKKKLDKGRSTPNISISAPNRKKIGPRSSSQPVLAAFVPAYVDQLKAQPFSLKEKITRWCKKSPMALYRSHMPPQDHDIEFPAQVYPDLLCDEFGRSLILEAEAKNPNAPTTKPRMECVLKRYPPNIHGIMSSYDRGDLEDKNGEGSKTDTSSPVAAPRKAKIAMPPPSAGDGNTRPPSNEPSLSKPPPPCPQRVLSNLSMIPHRCMSHLNEDALQQALEAVNKN